MTENYLTIQNGLLTIHTPTGRLENLVPVDHVSRETLN